MQDGAQPAEKTHFVRRLIRLAAASRPGGSNTELELLSRENNISVMLVCNFVVKNIDKFANMGM